MQVCTVLRSQVVTCQSR